MQSKEGPIITVRTETNKKWDEISQFYKNWWENNTPEAKRKRAEIGDFLIEHDVFTQGSIILDAASGSGPMLPYMKGCMGDTGHIYEVDISEGMLSLAAERVSRLGMQDQVELIQADAIDTGLPSESCDTVIVFNGFPHFVDRATEFLQECRRVLKPGGFFVIAHSMSRIQLDKMHKRQGFDTSIECLPQEANLRRMLQQENFFVTSCIDDSAKYDYFFVKAQTQKGYNEVT